MIRHGFSHSAATLIAPAMAGALVDPFRSIMPRLSYVMDQLAWALARVIPLPRAFTPELVSTLLLAASIAFLWGAVFAVANGFSGRAIDR